MYAALLAMVPLAASIEESKPDIPIRTAVEDDMFPESWRGGDAKASAESLPAFEKARSIRLVEMAFTKYPKEVLQPNLKRVYILRTMSFFGMTYGGTNSLDTVYLSNRGVDYGYTDLYIEESFHHEFSSILLRNNRRSLDIRAWTNCNDPEVKYQGNGTDALQSGMADTRYRDEWHDLGFLAQYATASVEEDFNMMAEGMFGGDPRFWRAVDKFPRIRKKFDLILKFYQNLSPEFTEKKLRSYAN